MKTKKRSLAGFDLILLLVLLAGAASVQAQDETVTGNLTVTGNSTLQGKLSVTGNHGVLFGGTFGSGTIPATGNGTRLMWYPGKGAFRVGTVTSDHWDDENIGQYSVAIGYNSVASGSNSAALSGGGVLGANSTAMSAGSVEYGTYSVAMSGGFVDGNYSVAMSGGMVNGSSYGIAMSGGTVEGDYATAIGQGTYAGWYRGVVVGSWNVDEPWSAGSPDSWISTDPIFIIGNGTDYTARHSALTVLKNGKVSIFGTNPSTAAIVLDPTTSPPEIKVDGKSVVLANSSGNVGIGTASPIGKLSVEHSANSASDILHLRNTSSGTSAYTELSFGNDAATESLVFGIGSSLNSASPDTAYVWNRRNGALQFGTNNAERMRIGANGNVGIGTTNPFNGQLHVNAANAGGVGGNVWITNSGSNTVGSAGRLSFSPDATTDSMPNAVIENVMTNTGTYASDLSFKIYHQSPENNIVERVRITGAGNVGVGTSTPATKLDVNGAAIVRGNMEITGNVTIQPQGDILMGEFDGSE